MVSEPPSQAVRGTRVQAEDAGGVHPALSANVVQTIRGEKPRCFPRVTLLRHIAPATKSVTARSAAASRTSALTTVLRDIGSWISSDYGK